MKKPEHNDCILQAIVAVILFALIVIRVFLKDEECGNWISVLNSMGLVVAVFTLHDELKKTYGQAKKFDLITGVFVVVIAVFCLLVLLIWLGIISLSTLWSDVILLVTLLVSLPVRFYKKLVGLWVE